MNYEWMPFESDTHYSGGPPPYYIWHAIAPGHPSAACGAWTPHPMAASQPTSPDHTVCPACLMLSSPIPAPTLGPNPIGN